MTKRTRGRKTDGPNRIAESPITTFGRTSPKRRPADCFGAYPPPPPQSRSLEARADVGASCSLRGLVVALILDRLPDPPKHQGPVVVASHVVFEQIAP